MRAELTFDTVLTAYGLTESAGTVTMCRRGDPPEVIAGTSGRAIPGLEVRVVDDDGAELPPGEPGEIVVRGYTVMSGYFEDPRPRPRPSTPTAGCTPATSGSWTTPATCHHRPHEGHVHRRRVQRLPGRDRGRPPRPRGCPRWRWSASPTSGMGEVGCAFVVPRRRRPPPTSELSWPERCSLGPRRHGQLQSAPLRAWWSTPCRSTPAARC